MRLWEFAVRRWQFTLLLFGLLLGVGFTTLKNIPRAEDPEFHAPVPIIVVAYPGADPADIERLIVDPIEDAINELDDIKRMDSRSLDGVGIIQVEFQWDQDPDEKYDEVVREVNRIRADLPADLASLEVRRTGSGLVNIMQVALVSPDASYRELDDLGRALSDELETLPGVRRSEVFALPEPEVRIAIDLERMGRAGISLGQVEAAVRGENASIPGGSVDLGLRKFNLKTSGSYDSLDEIANTVVASRNGRVVRLRDVAEISWDTSEQQYIGRYNGQRAIFVTASAKDRVDVFDVRKAIDGSLDRFEATLPPNVKLERGFDQTRNVKHRLDRLGHRFRDRHRAGAAHADPARPAGGERGDDLDPAVAVDRAGGALLHRILAQPAVHRGLRARARPAGGRFDRRRREHRALPARRLLAGRGGDRRHRPDRARGRWLHCDAAVRVPAAAVPAGGRRHIHPLTAGGGAVHRGRVAARFADGRPLPRQPPAASRRPRRRGQQGAAGIDARDPRRLRSGAARRAGCAEAHAACGAGLRARVVRPDAR